MGRPDKSVILDIKGNKFKRARTERNKGEVKDYIFCQGADAVCYTFSIDVMKELIKKVEESPELQKQFGVKISKEQ